MGDETDKALDPKTQGAWVVHHAKKLGTVAEPGPKYAQLVLAGKCGLLLNSLAATEQRVVSMDQVQSLAWMVNIPPRLELPSILEELERQRLIERGPDAVEVLGLTTAETLGHTSRIFEELGPGVEERASISMAEWTSERPFNATAITPRIADTFELPEAETHAALSQFGAIGFVDTERVGKEQVFFNGNLFRSQSAVKINHILDSLSQQEASAVREVLERLQQNGCIAAGIVEETLGHDLFNKLAQVGFLDISVVGNEAGNYHFVTAPAAFQKYGNAGLEDAFDLAKAFVSSLTYGMSVSGPGRGRIQFFRQLMDKLIAGGWVGPATAIGHDYRVLETKGVIQVRREAGGMYSMRLLKREIGEIALSVILQGEVGGAPLLKLPTASVSNYSEPEVNRTRLRKTVAGTDAAAIGDFIEALRTGRMQE